MRLWISLCLLASFTAPCKVFALPEVVATIKPLHSLVASVMDGVAEPKLLVSGNNSVHGFTVRPSQARMLERAEIVFYISDSMEGFLPKLPTVASQQRIAMATPPMVLLAGRAGGVWEPDEAEHPHGVSDAHIWLLPENAKKMVQRITDVLSARYPEYRARFQENAVKTIQHIDAVDRESTKLLAPVQSKPFIVFHDAYQYFEHAYGLHAAGSLTIRPDESISAKRASQIAVLFQKGGAVCVFREPFMTPKLLASITEGTKVREGVLDPEGTSIPEGKALYFTLVQSLASNLYACLSGSKDH